ncbi:hypothetical protein BRO54_3882 [Geobacillus proteiniphilus]|uniref:Uncharacterized protein n=1 Tax=Geobacillus proteiniphilus TaxID=860353 RepID=A0A1Q5SEB3_9BACL|nr:hypothetical protein BRO54_3882 [Geobacillus proteiniphilus]
MRLVPLGQLGKHFLRREHKPSCFKNLRADMAMNAELAETRPTP